MQLRLLDHAEQSSVGRIFFSKAVALPFLRFRMLRYGYIESPIPWREITLVRLLCRSKALVLLHQY